MPPHKPKASEVAADAKKIYIPHIRKHFPQWPSISYLCHSDSLPARPLQDPKHCRFGKSRSKRARMDLTLIAFFDRDAVDLALDWADGETTKIPVVMPAHDKRPGGDWETGKRLVSRLVMWLTESGAMYPEECLCRRSNLYATLTSPSNVANNYPLGPRVGVYSPHVGMI